MNEDQNTQLDMHVAETMALLSLEAYKVPLNADTPAEILPRLERNDIAFLRVRNFDRNSVQAMVVEHRDFIAIVFKGTDPVEAGIESFRDWRRNMDFAVPERPDELDGVKVHRGFWQGFRGIWNEMREFVAWWQKGADVATRLNSSRSTTPLGRVRRKPIYFTGHSQGGALAMAAGLTMRQWQGIGPVYTFGAPMLVAGKLPSHFRKPTVYRFERDHDVVPLVPGGIYRHIGRRIFIGSDNRIVFHQSLWSRFWGACGAWLRNPNQNAIDCHSMYGYWHDLRDHNIRRVLRPPIG